MAVDRSHADGWRYSHFRRRITVRTGAQRFFLFLGRGVPFTVKLILLKTAAEGNCIRKMGGPHAVCIENSRVP